MGACGATCGIQKERERERRAALVAAERAHPGFVWRTEPLGTSAGYPFDAICELGARLEELLPVRALPRAADKGCDWLYLLAGVHTPSLSELRDGIAPGNGPLPHLEETYLRIAFSPVGRFVTMQEVLFCAVASKESVTIVEEPVMGVRDRRLQFIVKGLQGILRKAKLVVLDMAFVAQPAPRIGPQPAYERAFGEAPTLWSFLYDEASPIATRAVVVLKTRRQSG